MGKRVKITLNMQNREEAIKTMVMRGMELPKAFEGPDFSDVVEVRIMEGGFVGVELDDCQYLYPSSSISRIVIYDEV